VRRPDDSRDRYLSEDELRRLKQALEQKRFRKGTKDFNKTNLRLNLLCADRGHDRYARDGDIPALLVGRHVRRGAIGSPGKTEGRQDAIRPDVSGAGRGDRRYPAVIGEDRILPSEPGQRVGGREWKEVSRTCSIEREFRIFDFTICVIPLHSGT
jgi:hypothetical protein